MTQTMQAPTATDQPRYQITNEDEQRCKRIADAWKAYDGEFEKPLTKMEDQPDDNVISNRCEQIVNAGVDFLFGKELEISVEEGAPQEAQDFLNTVWGRKEARLPLLQDLAMNGALAGRAFLRIVPGKQDGQYRLVTVDPATVYVQTAPQDVETPVCYCIQYSATEKDGSGKDCQMYYREEIWKVDPDEQDDDEEDTDAAALDENVTWTIQHWTQPTQATMQPKMDGWTPAGAPIPWLYPFPPMFSCKNRPRPNSFWGKPDITPDLIDMNKAIILLESSLNRTFKMFSQPVLYAPGMGGGTIDIKPGKIIQLPLPDQKIESVAMVSDSSNALAFAAVLRGNMDEQTGVSAETTGRPEAMPHGAMSGIAIEWRFQPLLKKTDKKQCLYGALIIAVSKALLVLNGMSGDIDVSLAWQSPIPKDDLQSWQTVPLKQAAGVSNTTIQREQGYDPDEEQALSQEEGQQKVLAAARGQGFPLAPGQMPPMPGQAMPGQQPPQTPFMGREGGTQS